MFCARCGHEIVPEGALFCKNCGMPVKPSGAEAAAETGFESDEAFASGGAFGSADVTMRESAGGAYLAQVAEPAFDGERPTSVLDVADEGYQTSILEEEYQTDALDGESQEYHTALIDETPGETARPVAPVSDTADEPFVGIEDRGASTTADALDELPVSAPAYADTTAEPYLDETPTMVLEVAQCALRRMRTGEVIEVTSFPFTIGKGQRADYRIEGNDRISDAHVQISSEQGLLQVTDLYSSNGTVVNGHRINPAEPVVVIPGSQFAIADELFGFETADDATTSGIVAPGGGAGPAGGDAAGPVPGSAFDVRDLAGFMIYDSQAVEAIDYLGYGHLFSTVLMCAWVYDDSPDKTAFERIAEVCATGALRAYAVLDRDVALDRDRIVRLAEECTGDLGALEQALRGLFVEACDDEAFQRALTAPDFADSNRPHAVACVLSAYEDHLRGKASPALDEVVVGDLARKGIDGRCIVPIASAHARVEGYGVTGEAFQSVEMTSAFRAGYLHALGNTALDLRREQGAAISAAGGDDIDADAAADFAVGTAGLAFAPSGLLSNRELGSYLEDGVWTSASIDERTKRIADAVLEMFSLDA